MSSKVSWYPWYPSDCPQVSPLGVLKCRGCSQGYLLGLASGWLGVSFRMSSRMSPKVGGQLLTYQLLLKTWTSKYYFFRIVVTKTPQINNTARLSTSTIFYMNQSSLLSESETAGIQYSLYRSRLIPPFSGSSEGAFGTRPDGTQGKMSF